MSFNTTIQPSQHSFPVAPDESVLEAALGHGLLLPYSCRNGACGVCKGRIVEGTVDYGEHQPATLTDAEKAVGLALFCCAKPLSDLVIESHEVTRVQEIPVRILPCRVERMQKVAHDVMVLSLRLPAGERLQFIAGQYIEVLQKEGKPRSFSLANAPHDDDCLELHVRQIAGGTFTQHVFNGMKERDILRIRGPLGTFFLREDLDKPVILVASGTGFAPVKAMIEHALKIGFPHPMHLYWGVRKATDLYMQDRIREWEARGIRFTPVVSDEPWDGRGGLVHEAVMQDLGDLSGFAVYACGSPLMVEAAHREFTTQRALPDGAFFSDAFTFAPKG